MLVIRAVLMASHTHLALVPSDLISHPPALQELMVIRVELSFVGFDFNVREELLEAVEVHVVDAPAVDALGEHGLVGETDGAGALVLVAVGGEDAVFSGGQVLLVLLVVHVHLAHYVLWFKSV